MITRQIKKNTKRCKKYDEKKRDGKRMEIQERIGRKRNVKKQKSESKKKA